MEIILRTATGKLFPIRWIGVATIDGKLRFEIARGDLSEVFSTFTNPNETKMLERIFNDDVKVFAGYTNFGGVAVNYDGAIVVTLGA